MKRLLILCVLAASGWAAYHRYHDRVAAAPPLPRASMADVPGPPRIAAPAGSATAAPEGDAGFRCDGRTRCPQMTSCEEATWFLRHCPGTEMDGNQDGVPCERQWCRR